LSCRETPWDEDEVLERWRRAVPKRRPWPSWTVQSRSLCRPPAVSPIKMAPKPLNQARLLAADLVDATLPEGL